LLYSMCPSSCLSFATTPPPPRSTLFPYTTLFRSGLRHIAYLVSLTADNRFDTGLIDGRMGRYALKDLAKRDEFSGLESTQIDFRSEEHTSELQSRENLVCRLLLEKKKNKY